MWILLPSLEIFTPKDFTTFRDASISLDKLSISKIDSPLAKAAQKIALWA